MNEKAIQILNDGHSLPMISLGVWKVFGAELEQTVMAALEAGYRHIDCAKLYQNEQEVGEIVRRSGIEEEVTITTKIWNEDIRTGRIIEAAHKSLEKLGQDQLDVLLIHWPAPGYQEAWEKFQQLQEEGLVRTIGVSNFMPHQLQEIMTSGGQVPAINQMEHHPHLQQQSARDFSIKSNIAVLAHTPLMQGRFKQISLFEELGKNYGRSPAQIVLRWNLQVGVGPIPKSTNASRIRENINILDFEISEIDIERINNLEINHRYSGDPNKVDF